MLWFAMVTISTIFIMIMVKESFKDVCSHEYVLLEEKVILDKSGDIKHKYKIYECERCKQIKRTSKY